MLNRLYAFLLKWILGRLIAALMSWYEEQKQKKIDKENLKKYREAVEGGNAEEIEKRGADLLNGSNRN